MDDDGGRGGALIGSGQNYCCLGVNFIIVSVFVFVFVFAFAFAFAFVFVCFFQFSERRWWETQGL